MTLSPTDLAAIAIVVLAMIVLAARDDARWFRFFRRRLNRKRAWGHYGKRTDIRTKPSALCDRANNEYRIDRPTRSVP